jgi:hypothetical protein
MLSSEASAQNFAERNGITLTARLPNMRTDEPTSVETLIWTAGGKPACCLYTVHGGGRVIPQPRFRFPPKLGKMSLRAERAERGTQIHRARLGRRITSRRLIHIAKLRAASGSRVMGHNVRYVLTFWMVQAAKWH